MWYYTMPYVTLQLKAVHYNGGSGMASNTNCDAGQAKVSDLPEYDPVASPDFMWGGIEGESFTHMISC